MYIVGTFFMVLATNLHNATCQLYLNILFNFEKKIITFGDRIFKEIRSCVVVQSLNRVQLFATPWTAANQASLSFTIP